MGLNNLGGGLDFFDEAEGDVLNCRYDLLGLSNPSSG